MSWMEINILIPRLISLFLILLQIFSLRWINWHIYLCLWPILLLCMLRYVRVYANLVFLWLHGLHLLLFLPHAWSCRFLCSFVIRPSHLSVQQVWVVGWSSSRFVSHVCLLYIGGVEKLNGIFVASHVVKAEAGFLRYLASSAAC